MLASESLPVYCMSLHSEPRRGVVSRTSVSLHCIIKLVEERLGEKGRSNGGWNQKASFSSPGKSKKKCSKFLSSGPRAQDHTELYLHNLLLLVTSALLRVCSVFPLRLKYPAVVLPFDSHHPPVPRAEPSRLIRLPLGSVKERLCQNLNILA